MSYGQSMTSVEIKDVLKKNIDSDVVKRELASINDD